MQQTLVVIGGGAAGIFCAVNAARMNRDLKVILLEKTNKLLSKVKVSGGGRCNVTHACFDIVEMSKKYPRGQHFVKKTFHQFFTTDTISWFEERDVQLKTEADGRMFPVSDSSQTIIDCLMKEVNKFAVDVRMMSEVKSLKKENEKFTIELTGNRQLVSDFVCIAAGGYPKSSMFEWLKNLGHTITEPRPSLFTFNLPQHPITSLMGVAVEHARIKVEATKLVETGPVLITHWGLSGPAVLRLSAWGAYELAALNYQCKIHINWLADQHEEMVRSELSKAKALHPAKQIGNLHMAGIPSRLWTFLLQHSGVETTCKLADINTKMLNSIVRHLTDFLCEVKGKTTFKEEFVTAGGIKLSEIDANTMMSKKLSGLYFAGEVMDVDGITGGFNFQHAWTSGWIAAKNITATT